MRVTRNRALGFVAVTIFVIVAATVLIFRFNSRRSSSGVCVAAQHEGYQTIKIFAAVGNNEVRTISLYYSVDEPFLRKGWTLEEAALWSTTDVGSKGSSNNLVIERVAPRALDGCPVNQDAELLDVPAPHFWQEEDKYWTHGQECTIILRVKLDSSGKVTSVEKGPDEYRSCPEIDQIVEAATQIAFRPAIRNGSPIAQRVSILYRTH